MNKKNLITIVSILIFIALAGVVVWFVGKNKQNEELKQLQQQDVGQGDSEKAENEAAEDTNSTEVNNEDIENFKDIQEKYSDVDTSNWKTYTDKNGLFSFKYPDDWEMELDNNDGRVSFKRKEDVMGTDGVLRKDKWVTKLSFVWYEDLEKIPDVGANRIEVNSLGDVFEKIPWIDKVGEWGMKDQFLISGVIVNGGYISFGLVFELDNNKTGWLVFHQIPDQTYLTDDEKGIISTLRFF